MPDIYMFVGIPASGKSRLAEAELLSKGKNVYLSRDREGGKVVDLVPKMTKAASEGASTIVLDCTFVDRASRAPFLAAAKSLNASVHCWFFDTSPELAQFNACWRMCERYGRVLRQEDLGTVKNDPNMYMPTALFAMVKKLEKPTDAEGFTSVRTIKPKRWDLPDQFKNRALILDYDMTVRRTKSGAKYPKTPDDVIAFPEAARKLSSLKAEGWLLLGASNQSGVAKNEPTMEGARACFDETNRQLGVDILYDFDYSAAGPITSWHRKPLPGMGVDAIWKHKLDPKQVTVIGDSTSDKTFAARCGFKFEWANDFFKLGVAP